MTLAESIARAAHVGQTEESTGDPYILHIERVANLVEGENAKAVAWLHDLLEDTSVTVADLERRGFSDEIINAVEVLTRKPTETYADYIEYVAKIGDPLAIAVKLADLRDHLRPNCPARLRPRYLKAWRTLTGEEWRD
jgi:(p)ppGpp synthase/HD superfamily hydrolase